MDNICRIVRNPKAQATDMVTMKQTVKGRRRIKRVGDLEMFICNKPFYDVLH